MVLLVWCQKKREKFGVWSREKQKEGKHYIIIGTTKSTRDVADTFTPTQDTKLHTTIGTDNVRNGMCKRKGEMIRDTAIQAANNVPVVLYTAQSRNPHLHTFQLLSLRDWGFFLV